MLNKYSFIVLSSLFLTSFSTQAEFSPNYFEAGLGATNLNLMEKVSSSGDSKPLASARVLIGGRLTSKNLWFETMYQYNGKFENNSTDIQGTLTEHQVTSYTSHNIAFGVKATTNPYTKLSAFIKGGIGQNRTQLSESIRITNSTNNSVSNSSSSQTKTTELFYGGFGMTFNLYKNTNLTLDLLSTHYTLSETELSDTTLFVSYNTFL